MGFCSTAAVQVAQAQEILKGPARTSLPVVLAGDLNASPVDQSPSAYQVFADAGDVDAWNAVGAGDGLTCCQLDDLSNPTSILDTRIDVVLLANGTVARSVTIVGDTPISRTASGFWPSDHAGVVATIEAIDR